MSKQWLYWVLLNPLIVHQTAGACKLGKPYSMQASLDLQAGILRNKGFDLIHGNWHFHHTLG
jgi:hypothetical protein